jgi:DNA repair ATPase RecN
MSLFNRNRGGGLQGYSPDTEIRKILGELRGFANTLRQVVDAPSSVKGMIMALQQDVQNLVDEMARNTSATQSMKQAFDLQNSKISDQTKAIDDLNKQVADLKNQSGPIDPEDLAAIQDSVTKVKANNDQLQEITNAVSTAAPNNVTDTPPQVVPGGAGSTPAPAANPTTGTPGDTSVPPTGLAGAPTDPNAPKQG